MEPQACPPLVHSREKRDSSRRRHGRPDTLLRSPCTQAWGRLAEEGASVLHERLASEFPLLTGMTGRIQRDVKT
jgi:hypothetical protein